MGNGLPQAPLAFGGEGEDGPAPLSWRRGPGDPPPPTELGQLTPEGVERRPGVYDRRDLPAGTAAEYLTSDFGRSPAEQDQHDEDRHTP
jgi:hypothetical protein